MNAGTVPRALAMVICDEAVASEIEWEVHTLENVRLRIEVGRFPHLRSFCVYLVLTHPRTGSFRGEIRLMRQGAKSEVRSVPFSVDFAQETDRVATHVEFGECRFPATGDYAFEVRVHDERSVLVQKGGAKFEAHSSEQEE